jgi:hypothetical protein
MPEGLGYLELAKEDTFDQFSFEPTRMDIGLETIMGPWEGWPAHDHGPMPAGNLALRAEMFDFTPAHSDQSSGGAGGLTGAALAADLSWVHQAALEGGYIETVTSNLAGFAPDGFDFRSSDMIGEVQLAAFDPAAIPGVDWIW